MTPDGGDHASIPSLLSEPLPFLTVGLPGIGGRLKQNPDDFVVEEIPAYEPCGEGEHLYLWIEKTNVSARDLELHLIRTLGISPAEVGMAGLKDRRAVTRQYISVPARCEVLVASIDAGGIRVLRSSRHGHKLRAGHARGNRFSVLIRDVRPEAAQNAQRIAAEIGFRGFPNFYGSQRFGRDDKTLQLGCELLAGARRPASIPWRDRRFLLRMSLSAVQSALFNAVVAERLRDELLARVLAGDVMQITPRGGMFVVSDAGVEQERFDRREIVLTGPMFGPKMIAPRDEPARRETRILSACGFREEDFTRFPNLTSGTRRPMLGWHEPPVVTQEAAGLRIEFQLPGGVYATMMLREFMKTPLTIDEPDIPAF